MTYVIGSCGRVFWHRTITWNMTTTIKGTGWKKRKYALGFESRLVEVEKEHRVKATIVGDGIQEEEEQARKRNRVQVQPG